jgi:hypothetical protein
MEKGQGWKQQALVSASKKHGKDDSFDQQAFITSSMESYASAKKNIEKKRKRSD